MPHGVGHKFTYRKPTKFLKGWNQLGLKPIEKIQNERKNAENFTQLHDMAGGTKSQ